jgi:hypothetical protein
MARRLLKEGRIPLIVVEYLSIAVGGTPGQDRVFVKEVTEAFTLHHFLESIQQLPGAK